jgi:hypothetical protein
MYSCPYDHSRGVSAAVIGPFHCLDASPAFARVSSAYGVIGALSALEHFLLRRRWKNHLLLQRYGCVIVSLVRKFTRGWVHE